MEEAVVEDRRLLYGTVLTLDEVRRAYRTRTGVCRGCRTEHPDIDWNARGLACSVCGRPRIFGAVQYVWNGWVKELPIGWFRGRRSIEKILAEEANDVSASQ